MMDSGRNHHNRVVVNDSGIPIMQKFNLPSGNGTEPSKDPSQRPPGEPGGSEVDCLIADQRQLSIFSDHSTSEIIPTLNSQPEDSLQLPDDYEQEPLEETWAEEVDRVIGPGYIKVAFEDSDIEENPTFDLSSEEDTSESLDEGTPPMRMREVVGDTGGNVNRVITSTSQHQLYEGNSSGSTDESTTNETHSEGVPTAPAPAPEPAPASSTTLTNIPKVNGNEIVRSILRGATQLRRENSIDIDQEYDLYRNIKIQDETFLMPNSVKRDLSETWYSSEYDYREGASGIGNSGKSLMAEQPASSTNENTTNGVKVQTTTVTTSAYLNADSSSSSVILMDATDPIASANVRKASESSLRMSMGINCPKATKANNASDTLALVVSSSGTGTISTTTVTSVYTNARNATQVSSSSICTGIMSATAVLWPPAQPIQPFSTSTAVPTSKSSSKVTVSTTSSISGISFLQRRQQQHAKLSCTTTQTPTPTRATQPQSIANRTMVRSPVPVIRTQQLAQLLTTRNEKQSNSNEAITSKSSSYTCPISVNMYQRPLASASTRSNLVPTSTANQTKCENLNQPSAGQSKPIFIPAQPSLENTLAAVFGYSPPKLQTTLPKSKPHKTPKKVTDNSLFDEKEQSQKSKLKFEQMTRTTETGLLVGGRRVHECNAGLLQQTSNEAKQKVAAFPSYDNNGVYSGPSDDPAHDPAKLNFNQTSLRSREISPIISPSFRSVSTNPTTTASTYTSYTTSLSSDCNPSRHNSTLDSYSMQDDGQISPPFSYTVVSDSFLNEPSCDSFLNEPSSQPNGNDWKTYLATRLRELGERRRNPDLSSSWSSETPSLSDSATARNCAHAENPWPRVENSNGRRNSELNPDFLSPWLSETPLLSDSTTARNCAHVENPWPRVENSNGRRNSELNPDFLSPWLSETPLLSDSTTARNCAHVENPWPRVENSNGRRNSELNPDFSSSWSSETPSLSDSTTAHNCARVENPWPRVENSNRSVCGANGEILPSVRSIPPEVNCVCIGRNVSGSGSTTSTTTITTTTTPTTTTTMTNTDAVVIPSTTTTTTVTSDNQLSLSVDSSGNVNQHWSQSFEIVVPNSSGVDHCISIQSTAETWLPTLHPAANHLPINRLDRINFALIPHQAVNEDEVAGAGAIAIPQRQIRYPPCGVMEGIPYGLMEGIPTYTAHNHNYGYNQPHYNGINGRQQMYNGPAMFPQYVMVGVPPVAVDYINTPPPLPYGYNFPPRNAPVIVSTVVTIPNAEPMAPIPRHNLFGYDVLNGPVVRNVPLPVNIAREERNRYRHPVLAPPVENNGPREDNLYSNFPLDQEFVDEVTIAFEYGTEGTGTEVSTDEDCLICFEPIREGQNVRRLPCTHLYHKNCADRWFQEKSRCAKCNSSVLINEPRDRIELYINGFGARHIRLRPRPVAAAAQDRMNVGPTDRGNNHRNDHHRNDHRRHDYHRNDHHRNDRHRNDHHRNDHHRNDHQRNDRHRNNGNSQAINQANMVITTIGLPEGGLGAVLNGGRNADANVQAQAAERPAAPFVAFMYVPEDRN